MLSEIDIAYLLTLGLIVCTYFVVERIDLCIVWTPEEIVLPPWKHFSRHFLTWTCACTQLLPDGSWIQWWRTCLSQMQSMLWYIRFLGTASYLLFLTSCVYTTCVSAPNHSIQRMHMLPKTTILTSSPRHLSLYFYATNHRQCMGEIRNPHTNLCLDTYSRKDSGRELQTWAHFFSRAHSNFPNQTFLFFCAIVYQC